DGGVDEHEGARVAAARELGVVADDQVAAGVAGEVGVAHVGQAGGHVAAHDDVVARAGVHGVGAAAAHEHVVVGRAGAGEGRAGVRGGGRRVVLQVAPEGVVPLAAVQAVAAATADQDVVGRTAVE